MFFLHHCLIGSSISRVFLLDLDTERRKNIVLGLSACHLFPDDATEERWGTALSSPLTNCLLTIFLRGLKWEEEEDTEEKRGRRKGRTKGLNRKKEDGKEEGARGKGAKKLVFSSTNGTSEVFPFSQRDGRQERWTETSA